MKVCDVLIVDDEIKTRQGLTKLIEMNAPNWSVVETARNGYDAIEKMKELNPELVLTDIRMPNMDGIDLAKELYQEFPDTKVVMLTGYKDLKYAQAAIRHGVLDFLLKPCPEKELLKVLDKTYRTIMEEMKEREEHLMEKQLIDENTIRSLMLRLPYDHTRLEKIKKDYLQKEVLLFKVTTYFPKTKSYRSKDLSLLQLSVSSVTEELLEKFDLSGILLPVLHDIYAIFIDSHTPISSFVQTLSKTINEVLGITVETHQSGLIEDLVQIPIHLENFIAKRNHMNRVTISSEEMTDTNLKIHTLNQNKIRIVHDEIMSKMMLGQVNEVKSYINNYITDLKTLSMEDAKVEVLILVLSFYEIIQKELTENNPEVGVGIQISQFHLLDEIDEVVDWARKHEELFYKELNTWFKSKNENIVAKSIRYIEDHYMESCNLKEVANFVHLSPNYFSNLFKKEKSESFVNYVTKFRIDKAKLLLSNTEMKIFEIAESVGYDDSNYFTTVFKRLTKMSPREYRNQGSKKII
ncbi:response regulator [Gracilibacillus salitolerans]|uniref:Response regulator n=1 Tax=Gracilibacillus salitolerans TaxID=2663022 RepID=A0A5Q2THD8_9BACI|nr:response regulator [Gracilibacillus salitolerans]QGH33551.1 response regulator [Gracilibacillus salitolerans]